MKDHIKIDPNTFQPILEKPKKPSNQKAKKKSKKEQPSKVEPQEKQPFDPINYYFEIKQTNNVIESINAYLKLQQ